MPTDEVTFGQRVGIDGVALAMYVQGILGGLVLALILTIYAGGPIVIIALENVPPGDALAMVLMSLVMCLVLGALGLATVGPYFLAGWALRRRKPWAHILGLVMAAISLSNCPFGLIAGVISLIALVDSKVVAELKAGPQDPDTGLHE